MEYAILWAVMFSIITTIVLQEMSMRIGIIANEDLENAIRDLFANKLMKLGSIWLVAISIGSRFIRSTVTSFRFMGKNIH